MNTKLFGLGLTLGIQRDLYKRRLETPPAEGGGAEEVYQNAARLEDIGIWVMEADS